jgi:hypothetical protein
MDPVVWTLPVQSGCAGDTFGGSAAFLPQVSGLPGSSLRSSRPDKVELSSAVAFTHARILKLERNGAAAGI